MRKASSHALPEDITGMRFGRRTALSRAGKTKAGEVRWHAACDCGRITNIPRSSLLKNTSCGCLSRELLGARKRTHGLKEASTYTVWCGMKQRCHNPNNSAYQAYGGRGIVMCERWRNSFENFLADMGQRPVGRSIDRVNNDGNYEPSNCRWATLEEQARNQRTTILTIDIVREIHGRCEHGESQRSVAARLGISKGAVSNVRSGRSWKDAQ